VDETTRTAINRLAANLCPAVNPAGVYCVRDALHGDTGHHSDLSGFDDPTDPTITDMYWDGPAVA
jgi:hypothetical protein